MPPTDDASMSPSYFPRSLGAREREWCEWLLPRDRPAYAPLAEEIDRLAVIGIGRWGEGDLVLGVEGQQVDLEAPMEPVAAYGEITFDDGSSLSLSVHHPDDEGCVELHLSGPAFAHYETLEERSRWCYSYWRPGDETPSGGPAPRLVGLDEGASTQGRETTRRMGTTQTGEAVKERGVTQSVNTPQATGSGPAGSATLYLALDPTRRVMWLHDASTGANTLVPVTNFYNELMLLKGQRDPAIALAHRRLFDMPEETSDDELRAAFRRYNVTWRKVDAARLGGVVAPGAERSGGFLARLARTLRGGTER